MKWIKRAALAIGALVVILALVPFFITLNDYIPAVEKEIAAVVGEPVSIDSLHASALPVPHARIDGITIGTSDEIKIGRLTFAPDLWSLLGSNKRIRSVEVHDLALSQKAIGMLVALAEQDRSSTASIVVDKIDLHGAVIKLEHSSFGPFDVQVRANTSGGPGEIVLKTQDGALNAHVTHDRNRYILDISAHAWTPPLGPPIRFDELNIKGVANNEHTELQDVNGKLYGGTLNGKVTISSSKGVSVQGNLGLREIELKQAAALVSPTTHVSGKLNASPTFSSRAPTFSQLAEALRLETPFTVHGGILYGFDIVSAATSLGKQGASGGQTRFDELAGHLVLEHRAYHFTDLKIASGAFGARGNVTISQSKALSGQLKTSVKALGASASVPLTVAGTLDSPMLYPNTTALAGAVVGTILAPGVGTAAGAKVGELVDQLFGKKR